MKRIYCCLLTLIIFTTLVIPGCKIDQPIYPDGTVGGGTGGGGSGSNFISYTFAGKTTRIESHIVFQVIAPGVVPEGSTQIIGGTEPANLFSIIAPTAVAGTFPDGLIAVGTDLVGEGTIVFTTLTSANGFNGTVKGTFTGQMNDKTGSPAGAISGSFSITN
ncbi:hypothetical protein [Mucilaginibacter sp.]|uniref:hypothetical protein n=1 Tax=Mucilaginibacter sp. TaxID=1882438 RepID=UPI0032653BC4